MGTGIRHIREEPRRQLPLDVEIPLLNISVLRIVVPAGSIVGGQCGIAVRGHKTRDVRRRETREVASRWRDNSGITEGPDCAQPNPFAPLRGNTELPAKLTSSWLHPTLLQGL